MGRTLLCASALGAVAAAAPGMASAVPQTVDCFGTANGGTPTRHEVGEPEADGYCIPRADGPQSYSIVITQQPESGSVEVRGNGTAYPYIVYTARVPGVTDGYSFHAVTNGTTTQISNTPTVLTQNVAATNDPPSCLGPQSGSGDALAIGAEVFAAACSDDEGENGPITIQIVQRPSRGTLRIDNSDPTGPQVYYRATCSGADDYSLTASDGSHTSAIYSASVTNAGSVPCTATTPAPVAPPRTVAPPATFSLRSVPSAITVGSDGSATIPVTGTPGSTGSVSLTATAPKASAAAVAKKRKSKKPKMLSLGSKRFTVPGSGVAKVRVKVSGKGLKALKKARKLAVKVTVKTDKATVVKTVTLKAPKAKGKKKSKR